MMAARRAAAGPVSSMFTALAAALLITAGCLPACATADERHLTLDGVDVRLEIASGTYPVGEEALIGWVRRSFGIVSAYYGRFPATTLRIELDPRGGDGIRGGKTWGYRGGLIRIDVGRQVTEEQLRNDWVLVHEMTHLALPDVGEDHQWLAEGLAVYVEGIERVQAGNRTAEDVFSEQLRQMPKGLPQPGDQGLDNTHTWARTYWGGALFCFVADVEIHERTGNRMGLQDAMRAVARDSGGLAADWPISRVFATADRATGTTVMSDLYAKMKDAPVATNLSALWQRLGVRDDAGAIHFDETAPLAAVRRAIMQPRVNRT